MEWTPLGPPVGKLASPQTGRSRGRSHRLTHTSMAQATSVQSWKAGLPCAVGLSQQGSSFLNSHSLPPSCTGLESYCLDCSQPRACTSANRGARLTSSALGHRGRTARVSVLPHFFRGWQHLRAPSHVTWALPHPGSGAVRPGCAPPSNALWSSVDSTWLDSH